MLTFLDHAANRLSEQVRLGEITQHEADATLDKIRRDAGESPLRPRSDNPRKAAHVPYSSLYLMTRALIAEGMSEHDAQIAAQHIDSASPRFQALSDKGREITQGEADAQAEASYLQTPDGLREHGDELRREQNQRAADIERGRAILSATGAPAESLDDDSILRLSKIDPTAGLPSRAERRRSKFVGHPDATIGSSSPTNDPSSNDIDENRRAAGGNEDQ